ncbi:MAG: mannan endo,4-beta-mannosidase [Acidobacteriota bacterium]|nr:mannan endo,4-beta-mannosidase [Acidobacteriota bacterium]
MRLSAPAKLSLFYFALALVVGASIFLSVNDPRAARRGPPSGFVHTAGTRFIVDGEPFRYAGANVAVMYRDEDRALMPQTLRHAAQLGLKVIRVWANGEGRAEDGVTSIGGDRADWPRTHAFRPAPDEWNEEAFVHLDRVLAEAARNHLRVQLTLSNWWRDTGGVTQYLRWAGVRDAVDDSAPYGVNAERASEFYTNDVTRRLYREHVEKIATRRNTVTGLLYRDDPAIFSYELMNEAQAPTGRWAERRAWVAEMSAYLKSLDANHMIESGSWGYRTAFERRAWLEEQKIKTLDYCDVHNYPRDDLDTFVTSPQSLAEFLKNRAAAAFSINKPLVVGEFGMGTEGYEGASQLDWFRAFFDAAQRAGASGASFWILTPDPRRGYGITYTTTRDEDLRAEIARSAQALAASSDFSPPASLLRAGQHLIPRQFEFTRADGDMEAKPKIEAVKDDAGSKNANSSNDAKNANDASDVKNAGDAKNPHTLLYRFKPQSAVRGRFEKLGGGEGYVWGAGVGFFEYVVPARADWRRVSEIVVRAHLQPVIPADARGRFHATRVTLFVNERDCGSRLVALEQSPDALIQEWHVDSLATRLAAARGRQLSIRFEVRVDADVPFGINISNFPEGYNAGETKPVEVELR